MRPKERKGPALERSQPERVAQESAGVEVSDVGRVRRREGCRLDRLELGEDARDLVVGSAERAEDDENVVVRLGQHDPLAAARPDQGADGVVIGRRSSAGRRHSGSAG